MTTLGLISDTHLLDRWRTLPATLPDCFDGVDLILHAGDIGDLSVLNDLSAIAPVIAVHGNDELAGAPDHLPFQQVVALAGQRILLTHGNHPDQAEEREVRRLGSWPRRLSWLADRAREVGASMVIYGHSHVPMALCYEGVWMINPGGIAAGSYLLRQTVQSVARLTLAPDGSPRVTHLDVNDPARIIDASVDITAQFGAAFDRVCEPLTAPDLDTRWFLSEIFPLDPDPIRDALRRVMFRCLDNGQPHISQQALVAELLDSPDLSCEIKNKLRNWGVTGP